VDVKRANTIFRRGSTTFFTCSLFFPPSVRDKVTILYAFVRTADDFVDAIPQDADGFHAFCDRYKAALNGGRADDPIVERFCSLARECDFPSEWVDAFLGTMERDLWKRIYNSIDETLDYMYGSAEVVGLMLARIMRLPDDALPYARLLGRSLQFVNFIRDIPEDLDMGRCYLPADEIRDAGLTGLSFDEARAHPEAFAAFIRQQITRYRQWREAAACGFELIPRQTRVAVRTAADMYDFTASVIYADPFVVFERKVKPRRAQMMLAALANLFRVEHIAR